MSLFVTRVLSTRPSWLDTCDWPSLFGVQVGGHRPRRRAGRQIYRRSEETRGADPQQLCDGSAGARGGAEGEAGRRYCCGVLRRCVNQRVTHGYGISLVQPKVLGNGEALILKSPACKSMPSPSSSTKKSLGLCTKRCPPTLQRGTSKHPEGLRSLDVFQKVYLHVCPPQVQPNMQGEDRSLRRRLGLAGWRPPLTGSLRARLRKLGFDQDWSWPQTGWQGTWFN